jgi:hypothetical protein
MMIKAPKGGRIFWIMLIQTVVGYAWLVSAIDKIRSETFLPGLPSELAKMSEETKYGWYSRFLEDAAIPNADLFGRLVTWGELLVGISLIALAGLLVLRGTDDRWALPASATAAVALLAGIFMNVNFHLAEGFYHPLAGYSDGLEGSVDLDSLMPLVQLVLLAVNLSIAWSGIRQLRKATPREATASVQPAAPKQSSGGPLGVER